MIWLPAIAQALGELDPEHAETYAQNAREAVDRIAMLDREIAMELTPLKDRPFVLLHDALGYFASHYGLASAGAVRLGDATAPGAARLVALREDLEADGVICAFPEIGQDPAPLEQLIEGTQVRLGGELDPAGGGLEPGADLYPELLRSTADVLRACLSAD